MPETSLADAFPTQLVIAESPPPSPSKYIRAIPDPKLDVIRTLLDTPEDEIDLARAKLAIDHMVDPTIDPAAVLVRLESMVKSIEGLLPVGASKGDKLEVLRTYLYVSGPHNSFSPYTYDIEDPEGTSLRGRLLTTYLERKKGNCVSMPVLFVILGQRLGLDVTIGRAPYHFFVMYRDESGRTMNIEATSGGHWARDEWIQAQSGMEPQAVESGLYMRFLGKREVVAEMTETLAALYRMEGKYEELHGLAQIILSHFPNNELGILSEHTAYGGVAQRDFVDKYPTRSQIPRSLEPAYAELDANNVYWFNRAIRLGWRPEPVAK